MNPLKDLKANEHRFPKKSLLKIEALDDERSLEHGIFAYLKAGWCRMGEPGTHVIVEDTWKALNEEVRYAQKCECSECKKGFSWNWKNKGETS